MTLEEMKEEEMHWSSGKGVRDPTRSIVRSSWLASFLCGEILIIRDLKEFYFWYFRKFWTK
jgi:hypothetical protein